jgi:hypothetical protein
MDDIGIDILKDRIFDIEFSKFDNANVECGYLY